MLLDTALSQKLRALNCSFVLDNNVLTVEPGMSIKSNRKVTKNAKPIKKLILGFYPKAVCLTVNDKIGGFRIVADLL